MTDLNIMTLVLDLNRQVVGFGLAISISKPKIVISHPNEISKAILSADKIHDLVLLWNGYVTALNKETCTVSFPKE